MARTSSWHLAMQHIGRYRRQWQLLWCLPLPASARGMGNQTHPASHDQTRSRSLLWQPAIKSQGSGEQSNVGTQHVAAGTHRTHLALSRLQACACLGSAPNWTPLATAGYSRKLAVGCRARRQALAMLLVQTCWPAERDGSVGGGSREAVICSLLWRQPAEHAAAQSSPGILQPPGPATQTQAAHQEAQHPSTFTRYRLVGSCAA